MDDIASVHKADDKRTIKSTDLSADFLGEIRTKFYCKSADFIVRLSSALISLTYLLTVGLLS